MKFDLHLQKMENTDFFPPTSISKNHREYVASVPHTVYTVVTEFTIQNSEFIQWNY